MHSFAIPGVLFFTQSCKPNRYLTCYLSRRLAGVMNIAPHPPPRRSAAARRQRGGSEAAKHFSPAFLSFSRCTFRTVPNRPRGLDIGILDIVGTCLLTDFTKEIHPRRQPNVPKSAENAPYREPIYAIVRSRQASRWVSKQLRK